MTELASLLLWVRAGRMIVIAAGVIAALTAVALVAKGRRVEGLMIGVAGLSAAVIAQVIIGYVAWRAHVSLEHDAPGPATGSDPRRRSDPGGGDPVSRA